VAAGAAQGQAPTLREELAHTLKVQGRMGIDVAVEMRLVDLKRSTMTRCAEG
jgi:hypothetical protein